MVPLINDLVEKSKKMGYKSIKEMLQDLYEKNNGVNDVGKILNISGMTVYKYLKSFNIEVKNKGGNRFPPKFDWDKIAKGRDYESTKEMFIDLYKEYSFADLSLIFHCSASTIHRLFKKHNIDISLNKKAKRTNKQVKETSKKIQNEESVALCSNCKTQPVGEGLRFLCRKCYKKNN